MRSSALHANAMPGRKGRTGRGSVMKKNLKRRLQTLARRVADMDLSVPRIRRSRSSAAGGVSTRCATPGCLRQKFRRWPNCCRDCGITSGGKHDADCDMRSARCRLREKAGASGAASAMGKGRAVMHWARAAPPTKTRKGVLPMKRPMKSEPEGEEQASPLPSRRAKEEPLPSRRAEEEPFPTRRAQEDQTFLFIPPVPKWSVDRPRRLPIGLRPREEVKTDACTE